MNHTLTSYILLFDNNLHATDGIRRIEIPLIQRDYAQGRHGASVERIRKDFVNALYDAVMHDNRPISLDFIYGDVVDGTLYPLDGQQRLTTLFLLHWYLSWQAGEPIKGQAWRNFTYATRASARQFCEALTNYRPPAGEADLKGWIVDQPWYFHGWEHDSTIRAMLVMLQALEQRFARASSEAFAAAWERLASTDHPAISFHLLPVVKNKLNDDLYIKMNSRGKPLTPFENFKAHFETLLKSACTTQADNFAHRVDTVWTDVIWAYKDADQLIDDQFMRYFRFVFDLCAWREGNRADSKVSLDQLAQSLFASDQRKAAEHLNFLFASFDIWVELDTRDAFNTWLRATNVGSSSALLLFNPLRTQPGQSRIDLFGGCCRHYGDSEWSQAHSLLLYAVLLHRMHNTADFPKQLRIVRNLIEASGGGEIRAQNMPALLEDVRSVIVDGTLDGVSTFNQKQIVNEKDKINLLAVHPELREVVYRLEDNRVLHGALTVFDLDPVQDPAIFVQRALAFLTLFEDVHCWPQLTGALLSLGDYSRKQDRYGGYQFFDFGSPRSEAVWRDLLASRKNPEVVQPLTQLLDQVAQSGNDLAVLKQIQQAFLAACERDHMLDWRYYLVKYLRMREGNSGRYAISQRGYSICMLDKTVMRSYYRDPYLSAVATTSGLNIPDNNLWFYGYETLRRCLERTSGTVTIESVDEGWRLANLPDEPEFVRHMDDIRSSFDIGSDWIYRVPQENGIDTTDRIILGAKLLHALDKRGL
ncbi:DUF262 domain-containing protein [Pseudomonas fulva]|uniref:DUF262 domain-containing protein n=1 Tax=Pseudomonas fulva TaxID=47880 RepID=UPI001F321FCE|nr:DUF262 domain-containing protein [Pseudomonas fulva]